MPDTPATDILRKDPAVMALSLAFIPASSPDRTTATLTLDQIPDEVKQYAEETYKTLRDNPNGRIRVTAGSKAELDAFTTQIISYCALRPEGALKFRKSPTPAKALPEFGMDFRIGDLKAGETPEAPEAPATPAKAAKASKAAK